jgi:MFS transporter, GlpU family, inner membrane protein
MRRYLYIIVIVIAGEMIFGLPFHTARFFRPTLLEVFGFTNTQLGDLFAVYGIAAMLSYFPGGAIADRFSARAMLSASLIATGLGGLYMATIPGALQMGLLYGVWGVTTIFLFWGALIRATREWGGDTEQGAAFGILEAGRGVAAAAFAALAVAALAHLLPGDPGLATDAERREAMQAVILIYTATAFASGVLVWFVIPETQHAAPGRFNPFPNMALVLRRPIVWAQALTVVCAYCCFKAADYYSLYAVQVLGMDEVQGAKLASYGAYLRPVAAITAGLIADRLDATRCIGAAFAILALAYAVLSAALPGSTSVGVIVLNLFVSLFAVFSLRAIYFALLEETRTPRHVTGAAVGMISLVGYTPEVFFAPVAGRILDASPGAAGHLDLFRLLVAIALGGIVVVAWLLWLKRRAGREIAAN